MRALWSRHRHELERLRQIVAPGQAPRCVKSDALAAAGIDAVQVGGGGGIVTVPVYSCSGLACPSADKQLVWTPQPPTSLVDDTERRDPATSRASVRYARVQDGWYILRDGD